jgi:tetratricopeptide (TPR) repeat protein
LNNLGIVYHKLGYYDKAISEFNKAKQIFENMHGKDYHFLASTFLNLGATYVIQKNYAKAIDAFHNAKRINKIAHHKDHPSIANISNNLGIIYCEHACYSKAITAFEEAKEIYTAVYNNNDHPLIANILQNLGIAYSGQASHDKAIKAYEEALGIKMEVLGQNHPSVADCLNQLAKAYIEQRQFERARKLYEQSIKIYRDSNHPIKKIILYNLSQSYIREGNTFLLKDKMDVEAARECYQKAKLDLDPILPIVHQEILANVKRFYGSNNLLAIIEHYRILIKLDPQNGSACHNLGCHIHIRAQIEKDKGDNGSYHAYLKEAEVYFEKAIELNAHSGIYTEYAQFMLLNLTSYSIYKVQNYLVKAIQLNQLDQSDKSLGYSDIERLTVNQTLQKLIDQYKEISFRAHLLARYLSIQAYLINNQLDEAKQIFNQFQEEILKLKQNYKREMIQLLSQVNLIKQFNIKKVEIFQQKIAMQQTAQEKEIQLIGALLTISQKAINNFKPSLPLKEDVKIDPELEAAIKLSLENSAAEIQKDSALTASDNSPSKRI